MDGEGKQELKEEPVVAPPDAVVHPRTVMVKHLRRYKTKNSNKHDINLLLGLDPRSYQNFNYHVTIGNYKKLASENVTKRHVGRWVDELKRQVTLVFLLVNSFNYQNDYVWKRSCR